MLVLGRRQILYFVADGQSGLQDKWIGGASALPPAGNAGHIRQTCLEALETLLLQNAVRWVPFSSQQIAAPTRVFFPLHRLLDVQVAFAIRPRFVRPAQFLRYLRSCGSSILSLASSEEAAS